MRACVRILFLMPTLRHSASSLPERCRTPQAEAYQIPQAESRRLICCLVIQTVEVALGQPGGQVGGDFGIALDPEEWGVPFVMVRARQAPAGLTGNIYDYIVHPGADNHADTGENATCVFGPGFCSH